MSELNDMSKSPQEPGATCFEGPGFVVSIKPSDLDPYVPTENEIEEWRVRSASEEAVRRLRQERDSQ